MRLQNGAKREKMNNKLNMRRIKFKSNFEFQYEVSNNVINSIIYKEVGSMAYITPDKFTGTAQAQQIKLFPSLNLQR